MCLVRLGSLHLIPDKMSVKANKTNQQYVKNIPLSKSPAVSPLLVFVHVVFFRVVALRTRSVHGEGIPTGTL